MPMVTVDKQVGEHYHDHEEPEQTQHLLAERAEQVGGLHCHHPLHLPLDLHGDLVPVLAGSDLHQHRRDQARGHFQRELSLLVSDFWPRPWPSPWS